VVVVKAVDVDSPDPSVVAAEVVAANVVVAVVMAKVEVVLDVLGCSPQNWHVASATQLQRPQST